MLGDSHAASLSLSLKETLSGMNINMLQASASGCFPVLDPTGQQRCNEFIEYMYHDFIPVNKNKIDGVIILGQTETYTISYATIAAKNYEYNYKSDKTEGSIFLDKESLFLNQLFKKEFAKNYIDIYNHTIPVLSDKGVPYMFDNNHFTKYGADLAVRKIIADPLVVDFLK